MNTYTLYNSTGEITGYFCGDAETLALNLTEGTSSIEGEYSHFDYKIVDGEAVLKSPEEQLQPLDDAWSDLRTKRNVLLQESDWTQSADSPLTDAQKQAWSSYRTQLRNLPSVTTDPRNPTWPSEP